MSLVPLLALVAACAPRVHFPVLEPAAIAIPPHIQTVAVAERVRPTTDGQLVLGTIEGIATGEGLFVDREGAAQARLGLVDTLSRSPRYRVVQPAVELTGAAAGATAPPVPWPEVQKICTDAGAQGLVLLEAFDSDSGITHDVRTETRTENGREREYKVHEAERHTTVTAAWRFYDAERGVILDELWNDSHADSWTAEGRTPEDAVAGLPDQRTTVRDLGWIAGQVYGRHIAPSWVEVMRKYYGSGDDRLKDAKDAVRNGRWEAAERLWAEAASSTDPEVRGRARYDLALARERAGDLPAALDLARQAADDLGDKRSRRYVEVLRDRIEAERLLQKQMQGVKP